MKQLGWRSQQLCFTVYVNSCDQLSTMGSLCRQVVTAVEVALTYAAAGSLRVPPRKAVASRYGPMNTLLGICLYSSRPAEVTSARSPAAESVQKTPRSGARLRAACMVPEVASGPSQAEQPSAGGSLSQRCSWVACRACASQHCFVPPLQPATRSGCVSIQKLRSAVSTSTLESQVNMSSSRQKGHACTKVRPEAGSTISTLAADRCTASLPFGAARADATCGPTCSATICESEKMAQVFGAVGCSIRTACRRAPPAPAQLLDQRAAKPSATSTGGIRFRDGC